MATVPWLGGGNIFVLYPHPTTYVLNDQCDVHPFRSVVGGRVAAEPARQILQGLPQNDFLTPEHNCGCGAMEGGVSKCVPFSWVMDRAQTKPKAHPQKKGEDTPACIDRLSGWWGWVGQTLLGTPNPPPLPLGACLLLGTAICCTLSIKTRWLSPRRLEPRQMCHYLSSTGPDSVPPSPSPRSVVCRAHTVPSGRMEGSRSESTPPIPGCNPIQACAGRVTVSPAGRFCPPPTALQPICTRQTLPPNRFFHRR